MLLPMLTHGYRYGKLVTDTPPLLLRKIKERNTTMNNINTDTIRNIIAFLAENEQYGDDWGEEIAELEKIIDVVEGE